MEQSKTLACRIELPELRAFSAIARAHDRTESAELRRLVRLWVRGELIEKPKAGGRPAEVEREHE